MKNKLIDLNDHLFTQMERLCAEDLEGDALEKEIQRTKAITAVSHQVIENGRLALAATKLASDYMGPKPILPAMLQDQSDT